MCLRIFLIGKKMKYQNWIQTSAYFKYRFNLKSAGTVQVFEDQMLMLIEQ